MTFRGAIATTAAGLSLIVSPLAQAQLSATDPVEVAFNGFPETRTYSVTCSENESYDVAFGFGAPEGIDIHGDGVLLKTLTRSSTPISDEMRTEIAAELQQFASVGSVTFRCGWRQAIPEKESGNYLRIELAGIRNCLTEAEQEKLEQVGSIDQTPFMRFIEIRPTTIAVEGGAVEPCATKSENEE